MAGTIDCKFQNSTGKNITLGVFGEDGNATYRSQMAPGEIDQYPLFPGDRAFVVWDQFLDTIITPILHFKVGPYDRFDVRLDNNGSVQIDVAHSYNGAPSAFLNP